MIGQSAGKSFAYILGVYLGDGCVTTQNARRKYWRHVFRLNTIDADFAEATRSALAGLDCKRIWVSTHPVKGGRPNHALSAAPDEDTLTAMVEITDGKRTLPYGIEDWPRDHVLAFIAGIMDSEGFVAANASNPTNRRFYMGFKSCDAWVPDFIRLLEKTGIRIGTVQTEKPRKPGYKPATRFTIKMQSWIDAGAYFNIARKQDRVTEWASAGAYERRARHARRLTSETTRRTPDIGR